MACKLDVSESGSKSSFRTGLSKTTRLDAAMLLQGWEQSGSKHQLGKEEGHGEQPLSPTWKLPEESVGHCEKQNLERERLFFSL